MSRDSSEFDARGMLHKQGVFCLFGEISTDITESAVEFVLAHNLRRSRSIKHLTFVINSSGGSLTDGFAIIDSIHSSTLPVHTLALGEISSAGLMIFMSGAKGGRGVAPNTTVMSHQWSGEITGKMHELLNAQKDFEQTTERMVQHYLAHSRLSRKQITSLLLPAHDVYLTAEQAVEYGLADRIQLP